MSDIDRFRVTMLVAICVSCGMCAPLLIPVWIYGEIKYNKIQQDKIKQDKIKQGSRK